MSSKKYLSNQILLGLIGFSIATALSILFQTVVAQVLNSNLNDVGRGLIAPDSVEFHRLAINLASKIKSQGWLNWSFNPFHEEAANVEVLAVMYVLFEVDPLVIVPINAFLHVLSALLISSIGRMIWPGRLGRVAGLVAALLFLLSPTALLWYGQIHKDGFLILGVLLVLHAWIASELPKINYWKNITFLISGVLLIATNESQTLKLIFVAAVGMYLVRIIGSYFFNPLKNSNKEIFIYKTFILVLLASASFFLSNGDLDNQKYVNLSAGNNVAGNRWQWEKTPWLPAYADSVIELAAENRFQLIEYGLHVGAESIYDKDVLPANAVDFLSYLPRATQIGLFGPFPSRWGEKYSAARVLSIFETTVWYVAALGILLGLNSRYNSSASQLIIFCVLMVAYYAVTSANMGGLYKLRFIYIKLLTLIGAGGWLTYLQHKIKFKELSRKLRVPDRTTGAPSSQFNEVNNRGGLAKSGVVVVLFTTMTFLGFFIRDVIMARMYGLGHELDAFVMASVVPMFMVSAFSVPLGTAVVPFVKRGRGSKHADISSFVQRILPFYICCAAIFTVLFLAGGAYMLHSSAWGLGIAQGQTAKIEILSVCMFAIFLLSGFLTIANGVLNALGKSYLPVTAQMLVPALVIISLLLFGEYFGVIVVPIAMFVGQVLNLVLLMRGLKNEGIVLLPSEIQISMPKEFLNQYFPIVIASVFMQISLPVSTMMSASLQSGDLGALGLGGKLVIFLTGLITAGLASVVLPYFSNMLVQNRLIDARRELSFLLLSATLASIPLTTLLYLCSSFVVTIFFEGGQFGSGSTVLVTSVMEFGVLQLPFFVVNMIMLKYAIAMQRPGWVLAASLIGLLANVLLNIFMSNLIGVAGVSLAMSIAVAITASVLLMVFFREREVALLDLVFILVNWFLFVAMVVCLHFRSWSGFLAAFLAYCLLLYGEWHSLSPSRHVYKEA